MERLLIASMVDEEGEMLPAFIVECEKLPSVEKRSSAVDQYRTGEKPANIAKMLGGKVAKE